MWKVKGIDGKEKYFTEDGIRREKDKVSHDLATSADLAQLHQYHNNILAALKDKDQNAISVHPSHLWQYGLAPPNSGPEGGAGPSGQAQCPDQSQAQGQCPPPQPLAPDWLALPDILDTIGAVGGIASAGEPDATPHHYNPQQIVDDLDDVLDVIHQEACNSKFSTHRRRKRRGRAGDKVKCAQYIAG